MHARAWSRFGYAGADAGGSDPISRKIAGSLRAGAARPVSADARKPKLTRLQTTFRAALFAVAMTSGLPLGIAATAPTAPSAKPIPPGVWPRTLALADAMAIVYQPQVIRWTDNQIDFRSAVAIAPTGAKEEAFGVVTATARTHVDKVAGIVVLANLRITRSDFPTLPGGGAAYAAKIQAKLIDRVRSVSLDRLKASLAASAAMPASVAVANVPPRIVVANVPTILVPIAGAPVLKPVDGGNGFSRVINTRALILKSPAEPQYFLHVYDGWLMASSLEGPWSQPFLAPSGIDAVARKIAAAGGVDMLDGGPRANPKPSLAQGVPAIQTTQVPTELIVFRGQPDFVPLVGTGLKWASNTTSDVLLDAASNTYYVLLAGRWFRAPALTGPWTYVANNALPADFARIPATSLAGAVLQAVAGTPQAREAVIESLIPQTATVPLKNGPKFSPRFDGAPQFVAVPGTALSYARNASVPVIQTSADAFYAVKAGVWFAATRPTGPWSIATSVPAAVYTIPPTSPIFYVTFVHIYGATPDVVFAGYTPGYLGAMHAPTGTVVYGTGYEYTPWIGNLWFPAPPTYGIAAAPVYNPRVGYTYAFATGLGTAEWTQPFLPAAHLHPGWWGGYPCCATTSANVYRAWARTAKKAGGGISGKALTAAAPQAATGTPVPSAPVATKARPALTPPAAALAPAANRGYDMSLVTSADSGNPGGSRPWPAAAASSQSAGPPGGVSAVQYYADLGEKPPAYNPNAAVNNHYADASGHVYRNTGSGWQQHAASGWTSAPAPPPEVDAEAQARSRADAAAEQAGSYGMSNTTRFTGNPNDGWTRRDSGDGGYSRTLGGDGGISAEAWQYNDDVTNAAFDIAANGGWWGPGIAIGWGGRLGGD
jgi:hypothetical protein